MLRVDVAGYRPQATRKQFALPQEGRSIVISFNSPPHLALRRELPTINPVNSFFFLSSQFPFLFVITSAIRSSRRRFNLFIYVLVFSRFVISRTRRRLLDSAAQCCPWLFLCR